MNHVVLVGRLTKDPELKYIPGEGTPVINFTLAINRPYKNKNGESEADFLFIEAWNKQAENIAKYCMKGSLVGVEGNLRTDKVTYQEQVRTVTKVRANQVTFLSSKSNNNSSEGTPTFTPSFEAPAGLDPNGFQAIDDDEIPF